jgi:endonuclease/exonuclease/phosphatase (EEP) superfamily protein YafD
LVRDSVFGRAGRGFVTAVLGLCLIALIGGAFGWLSPNLDLLANARSHLIGIAAFAAFALWLDERPVLVMMLGTFLTFAGHAILAQEAQGPLLTTARAAPAQSPGRWTVLSLNTSRSLGDLDTLTDGLVTANADVLVLTEFGPSKIEMLAELAKTYPYRADCARDWDCAIAILSRHPIVSSGSAPENDGPALAWATFGTGATALTVIGVQVAGPMGSTAIHARELASLPAAIQSHGGAVLVAGDFNTTPWSSAFARFEASSGLAHMGRFLPSYPSGAKGLPQLAIDHMFASKAVRFDEVWLGPDMGSDHRPLLATVEVPGQTVSSLP